MPQEDTPSPPAPSIDRHDRCENVLWVRGDHDVGTADRLRADLQHIIELDDADVVVDLSCVTFMDASIVAVLLGAQAAVPSPWVLRVRDPSPIAARVIVVCGLPPVLSWYGAA